MKEHELRQSELPEIGSQGVVSEVLAEKRNLNNRQIRALPMLQSLTGGVRLDDRLARPERTGAAPGIRPVTPAQNNESALFVTLYARGSSALL